MVVVVDVDVDVDVDVVLERRMYVCMYVCIYVCVFVFCVCVYGVWSMDVRRSESAAVTCLLFYKKKTGMGWEKNTMGNIGIVFPCSSSSSPSASSVEAKKTNKKTIGDDKGIVTLTTKGQCQCIELSWNRRQNKKKGPM